MMLGGTVLLTSCEVTINEDKSSSEESSEVKNGFSYENVEKSINGILPVDNEVIAGEYLIVKFDGLENTTLKDGFQHVGIALKVYRPDGGLYDESEDLLSNIEQQDPKIDNCHFYFAVPKEFAGGSMRLEYQLYDKYGDVSYDFSEEYNVVDALPPVTKNIAIETSLEAELYPQVFDYEYQAEKCPVEVGNTFELKLYVNNVSGFAVNQNGEVDLAYKITMENSAGEIGFTKEDVIQGSVEGEESYPLTFTLSYEDLSSGDYTWKIYVTDNAGDNYMNLTAPVTVK